MGLRLLGLLTVLSITLQVHANDIRLGLTTPTSHKIFSEIREANPALWTRTDDVIINTVGTEVISAIYVTDLRDDKDAEAFIESGSIGGKSVTIGLRSPSVLRGYRFEIEVFADDANARYNQYNSKGGYPASTSIYGVKGGLSAPYYDNGQYARKY